jgi:hypothetical protein
VAEVTARADAVLSALGPRGVRAPSGLLGGAAPDIVGAMGQTGVRRLICVPAAGAYLTGDPQAAWLIKAILPCVLAKQFADVREMRT